MVSTPSHRFGPVAYMIAAAVAVIGLLFTLGVATADRRAVAERFDSAAASAALAVQSELESIVHLLHGATSLREVRPDLTRDEFRHFFETSRPVAGVIGWGTLRVEGDAYLVDHFHSEAWATDWVGMDLARQRDLREPIRLSITQGDLWVTAFAPRPGLATRSAVLIHPHESQGAAFALVSADLLAAHIPAEVGPGISVSIDQSTQLAPSGTPFRNLTVGFGRHKWALTVMAESPALYPNDLIVPLGLLITAAFALMGMLVSRGVSQRRTLRDEVEDNERMNLAREQFIASVSHEIRTPLTAVVGYAEVLQQSWDDLTDDEALDMVQQISEQSMEVSALVKDLLVGSRADISSLHLDIDTVNVREVTERALASIPSEMRRDVTIGFDDDRTWSADPGRVAQIIRNLVVNAIKYGGNNVSIESRRLPGAVVLSVVDDGDGVSPQDVERIFQPFASVARSTQALPSVGLGLYVSSSLARAMGGSVTYRRHDGLTAFDLELPEARLESRIPVG
jgi:signal transduction histidine kinase